MNLSFRKCTSIDLEGLIEISRTTFIDAFETMNNPDDFKNYINRAFSIDQMTKELSNPNTSFYFTYVDGELAGYFKINERDAQHEHFDMNAIELERIYVLEKFQGRQIGKEMLFEVIQLAKSKEASYLWLGVWEKNLAAIRFYERYAFKKFGRHPYIIGADKQYDWLMKLEFI